MNLIKLTVVVANYAPCLATYLTTADVSLLSLVVINRLLIKYWFDRWNGEQRGIGAVRGGAQWLASRVKMAVWSCHYTGVSRFISCTASVLHGLQHAVVPLWSRSNAQSCVTGSGSVIVPV